MERATAHRYTSQQLAFVEAALRRGASRTAIAEFFGIGLSALSMLVYRHGLEAVAPPVPDLDELGRTYGISLVKPPRPSSKENLTNVKCPCIVRIRKVGIVYS